MSYGQQQNWQQQQPYQQQQYHQQPQFHTQPPPQMPAPYQGQQQNGGYQKKQYNNNQNQQPAVPKGPTIGEIGDNIEKWLTDNDMDALKKAAWVHHFRDIVRKYPQLPLTEFIDYLYAIRQTGADPLQKQITLTVKEERRGSGVFKATVVMSYHFHMGKAQATGLLEHFEVVPEPCKYLNPWTGEVINTWKATATVTRKDRGTTKYIAYLPEFAQMKPGYDGNPATPSGSWSAKPVMMLCKCALANAVRQAFEELFCGIYTVEEMTDKFSEDLYKGDFSPPANESEQQQDEAAEAPQQEMPAQAPQQETQPAPAAQVPQPVPEQQPAPQPANEDRLKRGKQEVWMYLSKARPDIAADPGLRQYAVGIISASTFEQLEQYMLEAQQGRFGWATPPVPNLQHAPIPAFDGTDPNSYQYVPSM